MIHRRLEAVIYQKLTTLHKAIILLGARQVGKTTLLLQLQDKLAAEGKKIRFLNCDLEEDRQAIYFTYNSIPFKLFWCYKSYKPVSKISDLKFHLLYTEQITVSWRLLCIIVL